MERILIPLVLVASLVVAGCTTKPTTQEPLEPTGEPLEGVEGALNNTTIPLKPPVARIQVFDVDGQLIYESNFVAENTTAPRPVHGGGAVTFLGSLSEAVEKTVGNTSEANEITRWEWSFGDGARAEGRGVSHAYRDTGGVFKVTLKVTDRNELTDVQVVTLGVQATRTINETLSFAGSLQAGTAGAAGQPGVDLAEHSLEVREQAEGFPVVVDSARITLTPNEPTSDFDLLLLDAEGEEVARSASFRPGGEEALEFDHAELAAGTYTLRVLLNAGANAGYKVEGEIVYLVVNPEVDALFGEHQHG